MTPESRVKAEIKRYLDAIGAYHYWPVPTGYGSPSVDCYVCVNGHFVAIEVKAPGKKPTPRQYLVLDKVRAAGGRPIVAMSVDDVRKYVV